jgi:uncharacterized membrane protein (UPF0127 family)
MREVIVSTVDGRLVAHACVAEATRDRMRGLIRSAPLQPAEGLVLSHAAQVHTFFLGYPIDVVFCNRSMEVLRIVPCLAPWRLSPIVRGSRYVLELPAGAAAGLRPGDQLSWSDL